MFASRVARSPTKAATSATGQHATLRSAFALQTRAPEEIPAREIPHGVTWSFSKIPILPPDHTNRPNGRSAVSPPRLPGLIQPKLVVGQADDPLELEADRVADHVMRMPDPGFSFMPAARQLSRKCAICEGNEEAEHPGHALSTGLEAKISRKVLEPDEFYDSVAPASETADMAPPRSDETETAQRDATGETGAVTPNYQHSLNQAVARGGAPLPEATRSFMESRLARGLSTVRVHSDDSADGLAKQINARAFTVGSNIFFAQSQYAPDTQEGQRLLAHELAHVVQQSDGRLSRQIQRTACSSYPGYDTSVDRLTYNCAGLALRDYKFVSPDTAVYQEITNEFTYANSPAGNCKAGEVKFWLWTYDIRLEDDRGTVIQPTWQDFHIVGGRMDAAGNDPTNVYSKNGRRPIHGPGTGPSFRPATKDLALDNDDNPGTTRQGRPVLKVRSNMHEELSCGGCK